MSLEEACRQERLAVERVDEDLLRTAGHLQAAWDATDEAEEGGASAQDTGVVRLRLLRFGLEEWAQRAVNHAVGIRNDGERWEWYRGIAGAIRSGLGWYESEAESGWIPGANVEGARATWAPLLEAIDLMVGAPLA